MNKSIVDGKTTLVHSEKHSKWLVVALGLVMGVVASSAQAAVVTTWQLGDFNSDGLQSDFNFNGAPTGNGPNMFGATGELCGSVACQPISFDSGPIGTDVFTTGFNFGAGRLAPNVTGTMSANINNGALTFSALDFGGIFFPDGTQLDLSPASGPGSVTVETLTSLGGGDWGVVARWQGPPIIGIQTDVPFMRLEGVMSTVVPLPATAWLFGSGLIGLVGFARKKNA